MLSFWRVRRDLSYYWRDESHEINYAIASGDILIGIKVESTDSRKGRGLEVFQNRLPNAQTLTINEELGVQQLNSTELCKLLISLLNGSSKMKKALGGVWT